MAALASFKVSWLFAVEERELLIFKIIVLLYLCVKNKRSAGAVGRRGKIVQSLSQRGSNKPL